jgi:hypothetical protein
MMENRQNERGGLSASRHCTGENVPPFECGGDCLSLNWSWSLETQLFETFVEAGVEL